MKPFPISTLCLAVIATAVGLSCLVGCRTAASLGLPVGATTNRLMPTVAEMRQTAGHRAELPTELAKMALPPHRVEAGDLLVLEPNDFNSPVRLQADQVVQQDGTIDLGAYGRLVVVGRSTAEIQQEVNAVVSRIEIAKQQSNIELAAHRSHDHSSAAQPDYGVNVRLVNQDSATFYVMGEVNAPGSYPLVGNETVFDALIAAGGLSTKANDHKVILVRPQSDGQPRVVLPVCYQQILQLGDVTTNYQLLPGDRIYVPAISIWEDIKQTLNVGGEKSCPHCRDYSR